MSRLVVRLSRARKPSAVREKWFERDAEAHSRFKSGFEVGEKGEQRRIYNVRAGSHDTWLGFVRLATDVEDFGNETIVHIETQFVWIRPSWREYGTSGCVAKLAAQEAYGWIAQRLNRERPSKPYTLMDSSNGRNDRGRKYVVRFKAALELECQERGATIQMP